MGAQVSSVPLREVRTGLLSVLLFAGCAATPDIRARIPGTDLELTRPAELAEGLSLSPKGDLLLMGSIRHSASLWDISTGRQTRSFKLASGITGYGGGVRVEFTPDGTKAVINMSRVKVFDVETGRELKDFPLHVGDLTVSPDSRTALAIGPDYATRFSLLDLETGEVLKKFKAHKDSGWRGTLYTVDVSPDGRYGLTSSFDRTARLWDLRTGEEVRRFIGHEGSFRKGMVNSARFSPDGRTMISAGSDKTLRLWEVESGRLLRTFRGHTDAVKMAAFSQDGKYVISGDCDAAVRIWDVATGETLRVFEGHSKGYTSGWGALGINGVGFTRDGKRALSAGDASARIWDSASGAEIAMLVSFKDGEWLAITPEGYYNSSANGHKYMRLLKGDKAYGMEQFYDVFYRPDIVAAKLKGEDIRGLASLTMDDAIKSPPPAVEIASPPKATAQSSVKVCYRVASAGGGIGELRVFHNGKLIQSDGYYRTAPERTQLASLDSKASYEGMRDLVVKGKAGVQRITTQPKADVFEDCREVDPVTGENEVSVAAFNKENTVQSLLKTVRFDSTRKPEEPHLYILSIGMDRYKDGSVNLKYAAKDASDIAAKLRERSATVFKPEDIHHELLTDSKADKASILAKVEEYSRLIKPQDTFILFAAGHGILWQDQYYLLTHDFDGQTGAGSMFGSDEIVDMSKKIRALSQLLIFDTCHAGGVDYLVSGLYDARMSVLAKRMGLHIFASSGDQQAALDGYQGNGLFTHALLRGLDRPGTVTMAGLGESAKRMTSELSKGMGRSQVPLIIDFGRDSELHVDAPLPND